MEKKMKSLLLKKRQAEAYVKRLEEFKDTYDESKAEQTSTCLMQLESHHAEYLDAVAKVLELDDKMDTVEACINDRCDMEERYRRLRGFFLKMQPTEVNPLNASVLMSSTVANTSSAINIRLPKIELPTFDGDETKWLTFRDRFVSMIDSSTEIPAIMKLQYLLASLKGEAGLQFEHTTITADNYGTTWAALLKRYDNKRMLIREYYRKLHFIPAMNGGSIDELAMLVDEFIRHVNGLRKLDQPIEAWDTPLTNLLFLKLDSESLLAWERHSSASLQDRFIDIMNFLQDRIRILRSTLSFTKQREPISTTVAGGLGRTASKGSATSHLHRGPASHALTSSRDIAPGAKQSSSCLLGCSERHALRVCPAFDRRPVNERRSIVAKHRLCWNCLSADHQVRSCKSNYSCRYCSERHHTLLHEHSPSNITMTALSGDTVILETAMIMLVDDYGNRFKARALLDSGSTSNFISESLAKRLQTPRNSVNIAISGIGQTVQQVKDSIVATLESNRHTFSTKLEFFILRMPTTDIPSVPIDVSTWQFPELSLADPNYHTPGPVDVVIGGEAFWEIHTGRKWSLGPGKPWLMETPFGWAIAGNATHHNPSCNISRVTCAAVIEDPLESIMQRFWEAETIPDGPALSVEETLCEEHYAATVERHSSGRYVVRLPRNTTSGVTLGASREIADRRLLSLERRLKGDPEMARAYDKFMEEYERMGHMKKLIEPVNDSISHCYIPHHAVVKESSTTTKVRVVFDASCKTSSGYSLNDTLLVGPIVQEDLLAIILRFRTHPIALAADIEKMYRQILHHVEDRNLLRIRYRRKATDPIDTYELTTDDLHLAETTLCHASQQNSFSEDIQALAAGKQVAKTSRLKWLKPYLDETGVLRVGGRLGNMAASASTKHPMLLSATHPMAVLLVTAYHLRLLHAGPQLLLSTLRQRFWVIGGRSLAKSVYHRCLQCFKTKPTLIQQSVADLPESRVTPTRPFSVCGVDYCGPLFIKSTVRNRSPSKAYIAIFVCFSTRAIHIELVSDLTTTAFLSALRRFVARRGMVKELHSDNATTFKGAANELHRIYKMLKQNEDDRKSIFDWCADNGMVWRFIPPRAPHFGGLWEAAVKAAKHHLLRTIGTTSITYENMLTLLTQIESCLNSRPLVPMSEDPCDLEVLTPGHFLVGGNMQSVPDIDYRNIPSNRLKEYQMVQRNVRCIWQRWQREYTQQLQARSSFGSRSSVELKENQLVLIKEDNVHPTVWPKGRIVKLHPGKDGVIRVVTVRTAPDKYIVRPVARLALLPNPM